MNRRTFLRNASGIFIPALLVPRKSIGQAFSINDSAFAGNATLAPSGGGASYLYQQDFESGTEPTGWTHGGTVNYNYTAAPLVGSKSLSISAAGWADYTFGSSYSELYCYFVCYFTAYNTALVNQAWQVNGANTQFSMKLDSTGHAFVMVPDGSHQSAATVTALPLSTLVHVWTHFKVGSGTNAIGSVGWSTDGTMPTSGNQYAQYTTGTSTTNFNTLDMEDLGASVAVIYDKIRIAQSSIGSNPT
jgi:hypothetical protein